MAENETDFEMVRRHVREGEAHVKRQREIVAGLKAGDPATCEAEALLAQFEDLLTQHKTHLARIEARNAIIPDIEFKGQRAARYRTEAERVRRVVETMRNEEAQQQLLNVAIMYEQMAEILERISNSASIRQFREV